MTRAERAKQFMAFAALGGYEELIDETKKTVCPKRELSEEKAEELSALVSTLHKGDVVCVTHYVNDGYVLTEGVVASVDLALKKMEVVKTVIGFADVIDISVTCRGLL